MTDSFDSFCNSYEEGGKEDFVAQRALVAGGNTNTVAQHVLVQPVCMQTAVVCRGIPSFNYINCPSQSSKAVLNRVMRYMRIEPRNSKYTHTHTHTRTPACMHTHTHTLVRGASARVGSWNSRALERNQKEVKGRVYGHLEQMEQHLRAVRRAEKRTDTKHKLLDLENGLNTENSVHSASASGMCLVSVSAKTAHLEAGFSSLRPGSPG